MASRTEQMVARLKDLQDMQTLICKQRNSRNIGKKVKCLVEKRLTHDKLLARTQGNIRVLFQGADDLIGSFVNLKIIQAGAVNMIGSLIE